MKTSMKYLIISALIPLLFGCVLPGTGTVHIRNELSGGQDITSIYLYPSGSLEKGESIISSPLLPNNTIAEYGITPGDYLIEAILDDGGTALRTVAIEENEIEIVWLRDSDIQ